MTTAQNRHIRDLERRLEAQRTMHESMLDLFNAVLHHHGGRITIPEGSVLAASRRVIKPRIAENGDLVIETDEAMPGTVRGGLLGRVKAALRG